MDEAFLLLMDGKLRSHSEIMNFLKPYEPPPPPPPPQDAGEAKLLRRTCRARSTSTCPSGQARTEAKGSTRSSTCRGAHASSGTGSGRRETTYDTACRRPEEAPGICQRCCCGEKSGTCQRLRER